MKQTYDFKNEVNEKGFPAGGFVKAIGVDITWQNGPLQEDGILLEPNGAFVETVLNAVRERIEFYQTAAGGTFACEENVLALGHIESALYQMEKRTKNRIARGLEGTHTA